MMKTLKSILISRDQLESFYDGSTGVGLHLWRAVHKETPPDQNPLYPDFAPRMVRGRLRNPDVKLLIIGGQEYVEAELVKGTSLFDKPGTFGFSNFHYVEIPAGTEIPEGLLIIQGEYNERYGATHYTICPNFRMLKSLFISLLDRLASNAIAARRGASHG